MVIFILLFFVLLCYVIQRKLELLIISFIKGPKNEVEIKEEQEKILGKMQELDKLRNLVLAIDNTSSFDVYSTLIKRITRIENELKESKMKSSLKILCSLFLNPYSDLICSKGEKEAS
jgi:hypothetical protein